MNSMSNTVDSTVAIDDAIEVDVAAATIASGLAVGTVGPQQ